METAEVRQQEGQFLAVLITSASRCCVKTEPQIANTREGLGEARSNGRWTRMTVVNLPCCHSATARKKLLVTRAAEQRAVEV